MSPLRPASTVAAPLASQPQVIVVGSFRSVEPLALGGARQGGRIAALGAGACAFRWVRTFSITAGPSIQAMMRTAPPQAEQVAISMPKTRLRRCAWASSRRAVRRVLAPLDPRSYQADHPGPAWPVSLAPGRGCSAQRPLWPIHREWIRAASAAPRSGRVSGRYEQNGSDSLSALAPTLPAARWSPAARRWRARITV